MDTVRLTTWMIAAGLLVYGMVATTNWLTEGFTTLGPWLD